MGGEGFKEIGKEAPSRDEEGVTALVWLGWVK